MGISGSTGMILAIMATRINRREILKGAVALGAFGAAAALTPFVRGAEASDDSSSKPIRMGFIGVGGRGTELLNDVLRHRDVQIPGVCDIDPKHLKRALDL